MATAYRRSPDRRQTTHPARRGPFPPAPAAQVVLACGLLHTPQACGGTPTGAPPVPDIRGIDDITGTAHDRQGHIPSRPVPRPLLFRGVSGPGQRRVRGVDDERGP